MSFFFFLDISYIYYIYLYLYTGKMKIRYLIRNLWHKPRLCICLKLCIHPFKTLGHAFWTLAKLLKSSEKTKYLAKTLKNTMLPESAPMFLLQVQDKVFLTDCLTLLVRNF